ncbi:hypothetical protein HK102_011136, partial [Quaeritorhiza haematococci]
MLNHGRLVPWRFFYLFLFVGVALIFSPLRQFVEGVPHPLISITTSSYGASSVETTPPQVFRRVEPSPTPTTANPTPVTGSINSGGSSAIQILTTTTTSPLPSSSTSSSSTSTTSPVSMFPHLKPLEPSNGQHLLAAWIDYTIDTPQAFNARLGKNASAFGVAREIPFPTEPPSNPRADPTRIYDMIEDTHTDAAIHLTIYPSQGLDSITDEDLSKLVAECNALNQRGRRVFLRFAPDMNGPWFAYGNQPVRFLEVWRRMAGILRGGIESGAMTALVWAPHVGLGYPFGNASVGVGSAEYSALDTNGDGVLDARDDPYSPWYPGDELVDWVGLSIYHISSQFPHDANRPAPPTKFIDSITNSNNATFANFYKIYSEQKAKPFMIAETNAAYYKGPGSSSAPTPPPPTVSPDRDLVVDE